MTFSVDKSKWPRVEFGDVVENSNLSTRTPLEDGIERYLGLDHLDSGELKIRRSGDVSEGVTFTKIVMPGQTVFGKRRSYQKKVAYAEFMAVCSGDILVFSPKLKSLLKEYLPFVVASEGFLAKAIETSAGSLSPRTRWSDLAKFEFLLPPVEIQRQIVKLLWSIENHLEILQNLLGSLGALEAQQLRRMIDMEGDQQALGELLISNIGGIWGSNPGEDDVDVPVIRGTDITLNGDIDFESAPIRSMRSIDLGKKRLLEGDIVLEKSGGSPDQPVGKMGYVTALNLDLAASNFCVVLRPDYNKVQPYYLFLLLRSLYLNGYLAAFIGKTTNLANLRIPEMLKKTVHIPSSDDQQNEINSYQEMRNSKKKILDEIGTTKKLRSVVMNVIFDVKIKS
jgi:type I restriction enzyme S subunit